MDYGITSGRLMGELAGEVLRVIAKVARVPRHRPQYELAIWVAGPCSGWLIDWRVN